MAVTTAAPARVAQRVWRWKWRILGLLVFVGLTGLALYLSASKGQQTVAPVVPTGPKPVFAQAEVAPRVERKLSFTASGQLQRLNVAAGDKVKAGDVVAQLDTTDLALKVQDAQANLTLQQALIHQQVEPAAPADVTAAKASVDSAVAKQHRVDSGPTAGDVKTAEEAVAAAQASLDNARAAYRKATQGPTTSDVASAEAGLRSAQAQLASAQQKLSDTKAKPRPEDVTTAALALEQAKNTLWSQQVSRDATCGTFGPNSTQCHSADAAVAAQETAVKTADANLTTAKKPATPEELAAAQEGVRSAQAAVDSAQASLNQVKSGPTSADRDAAQAQVDQAAANLRSAQAKLDQLQTGSTSADKAAARNDLEQARAGLDKLTRDASPATIEVGQAKIHQAEVAVSEAEQALADATLRSPIDGVVTSINAKPGELVGPTGPVLTVADLSTLQFQTRDLDEISAAKVFVGQAVQVTIPALDKRVFAGKVTEIDAEPTVSASGDVSYVAKVVLNDPPKELRWGQTARVEFVQTK